jgi:cell division protein FtsW (lipid II flippase)
MSQPAAAAGPSSSGSAPAPRITTRRGIELFLLIFAAVIVTGALVVVELNQAARLTQELLFYGAAFLALFGAAHLAVRRWAPFADPLILPLAALLNGLGLVIIHRIDLGDAEEAARAGKQFSAHAPSQVLWTTIALGLFVGVLVLVKDHRTIAKYGYTCGLIGLVALALPGVLPDFLAPTTNGAKIWLSLGGVLSIQPGEFAKILLMIFFAAFLVSKRELFTTAGRRFLGVDFPRARDLAPVLVAWAMSIGIVVLERDLGTSLLFFGILLVMLYIATERAVWVFIGLSLFAAGCIIAYPLFGHVQERVDAWLNPLESKSGYQLSQALFGLASGGIGGSGLGAGRPYTVPLAESDFIISSFGEEIGFIGLAALFLVYLLIMMRGVRSALAVRDSFGKLLGGGVSFSLALQLFVVAGGVTGLIPLTGLTAPFLAQGGSSLLANYMLVALLLRISDAARRPQSPSKPKPKQAPIAEAHTELVERPR